MAETNEALIALTQRIVIERLQAPPLSATETQRNPSTAFWNSASFLRLAQMDV